MVCEWHTSLSFPCLCSGVLGVASGEGIIVIGCRATGPVIHIFDADTGLPLRSFIDSGGPFSSHYFWYLLWITICLHDRDGQGLVRLRRPERCDRGHGFMLDPWKF